jgi:hypothetical protein
VAKILSDPTATRTDQAVNGSDSSLCHEFCSPRSWEINPLQRMEWLAMAEYYPILARAVSGLATNNAQTRQELYEHARTVLVAQLGGRAPQVSLLLERIELELAILTTEMGSIRA